MGYRTVSRLVAPFSEVNPRRPQSKKEEPGSNRRVPIRQGALIGLEIRPKPATLCSLSPDDTAALIRNALHRLFSFRWGSPCFLALLLANPASAGLVHRWSFDEAAGSAARGTVLTDPISDAGAVVRGNGATFTGTTLAPPGTTDGNQGDTQIAYIDLPNGVISLKTNLTVEMWAAPLGLRSWQRLFEFGRNAGPGDGQGAPGEWTGTGRHGTGQQSNGRGHFPRDLSDRPGDRAAAARVQPRRDHRKRAQRDRPEHAGNPLPHGSDVCRRQRRFWKGRRALHLVSRRSAGRITRSARPPARPRGCEQLAGPLARQRRSAG